MLDQVSSRSLKDEKEGLIEDFQEEDLMRKTIVGYAKAQVKGLEHVPGVQVGSACAASIDNVFVCFKFPLHLSGSSGQQT
jgi:hypothetical protein